VLSIVRSARAGVSTWRSRHNSERWFGNLLGNQKLMRKVRIGASMLKYLLFIFAGIRCKGMFENSTYPWSPATPEGAERLRQDTKALKMRWKNRIHQIANLLSRNATKGAMRKAG
jgi:hypothetical protein